jgi:hypothetical protein
VSRSLLLPSLLVAALTGCAPQEDELARELPRFTLRDADGGQHTRDALLEEGAGLVVVVTAPTMACQEAQEGWSEALLAARPEDGLLVFLEDLSQSWFEDTALRHLSEAYEPGEPPLILIDRDGRQRRALGVEEEATVVFVFDARGQRVHVQTEPFSAERAQAAWDALAESQR